MKNRKKNFINLMLLTCMIFGISTPLVAGRHKKRRAKRHLRIHVQRSKGKHSPKRRKHRAKKGKRVKAQGLKKRTTKSTKHHNKKPAHRQHRIRFKRRKRR